MTQSKFCRYLWIISITYTIFSSSTMAIAQLPVFKDGDTLCFVGNSITMNAQFYNYLELFYATRHPEQTIEFHNCGISGDVAGGVLARIEDDILIHRPTWCVIMVGMNDIGRSLYAPNSGNERALNKKRDNLLVQYFESIDSIINILVDNGTKVILQTPTIYDQTAEMPTTNYYGANDALKKCAAYIKSTAKKYNLPVVDYWSPMMKINKSLQKSDPRATIIGSDRVHPGSIGHFLMTSELLKTLHPQKMVSRCKLHVKNNKILESANCNINNVNFENNGLKFDLLEFALPFPVYSHDFNLDSLVDFTGTYNREVIIIKSLQKGKYELHIDDVSIGHFSHKEFKKGINISKYPQTPQNIQSNAIHQLFDQYWELEKRLRRLQYVEMKILRINPDANTYTFEELTNIFSEKMGQLHGTSQSVLDYFTRSFEAYMKDKPLQLHLKGEADNIFKQIQKLRTPSTHRINIQRIS